MNYLLEILAFFGAFIAFCGMTTCFLFDIDFSSKPSVKSSGSEKNMKSDESDNFIDASTSSPIITAKMMDNEKGS